MSYDAESLQKGVIVLLKSGIGAALDAVEAEWVDTDPVTLPNVVTWFEGHNPAILPLESTAFPFVSAMATGQTPKPTPLRWGYQERETLLLLEVVVAATDVATVNKIIQRYVRAIEAVLHTERTIEGYTQMDYEPMVQVSDATRHAKVAQADMFNEADVDYVQGARITIACEAGV